MTTKSKTGDIYRMFLKEDPNTIIRRPNLRRFSKQEGIDYIIGNNKWLIDEKKFIKTLNPKHITKHDYEIPRIRTLGGCVEEWNKLHPNGRTCINRHTIENLLIDVDVFKYKIGCHTWLINYDQIEKKLNILFFRNSKSKK